MTKTRVVHCMLEPYDIYIGRPGIYGNPFSHKNGTLAIYKTNTVEEAVSKYEEYARMNSEILNSLWSLKGKTLGCWCAKKDGLTILDTPFKCHGQVLLKLIKEFCGGSED